MMDFLYYGLKVCICSGVLFSYYWVALRNKLFHQWNRFYLLLSIVMSLIVPLLTFQFTAPNALDNQVFHVLSSVQETNVFVVSNTASEAPKITAEQWLAAVYIFISLCLFVASLLFLYKIIIIIKKHAVQRLQSVNFINTEAAGTPFSFFNYIVWNKNISLETQSGQQIFQHELTHVKQKHSIDKVFCLLVLIPYWANPFFWLMRKELNDIHEFIADKNSVEKNNTAAFAQMILEAAYPKQLQIFANPFFQSSIKRRLSMLTKNKNPRVNYLVRLLVLPLLVVVVAAFTLKAETKLKQRKDFIIQEDNFPNQKSKIPIITIQNENDNTNPLANKSLTDTTPVVTYKGREVKQVIELKDAETTDYIVVFKDGKKEIISKEEAKKAHLTNASTAMFTGNIIVKGEMIKDTTPDRLKEVVVQGYKLESKPIEGPVFTKLEVEPQFIGGAQELTKFLSQHLNANVPVANNAPAGTYTVVAQFIVDKEGKLSDIKTLTNLGYGMEEEVRRVLKVSPDWEPGMQNGHKVNAYKKQPITFIVPAKNETTSNSQNKMPTIKLDALKSLADTKWSGLIDGYEIQSYTVNVDDKKGGVWEHLNTGNTFDVTTKEMIAGLKQGDIITFEKIRGTKNGQEKSFPAKFFQID